MSVVVVPHCKPQLASHPAFAASLETLRGMGVRGAVRPGRAVRAGGCRRGARSWPGLPVAAGRGSVMTETPGERIARARRRRGLSQAVLAGLVGRSETGLSQVERGKRGVDSHAVLTRMATVLRVDMAELTGPDGDGEEGQRVYEPAAQIEQAMMRYDAAAAAIGGRDPEGTGSAEHLHAMARAAYQGYQATRYDDTGRVLPALIIQAEAASRAVGLDNPQMCAVRALVYDTAAALLNRVGETALAWAAADRALGAAEQSGRPSLAAASAWRMSYVIGSRSHQAEALELAMTAAAALERTMRTTGCAQRVRRAAPGRRDRRRRDLRPRHDPRPPGEGTRDR